MENTSYTDILAELIKKWKIKELFLFYILSILLTPGLILNLPPIEIQKDKKDKKDDKNKIEKEIFFSKKSTWSSAAFHSLILTAIFAFILFHKPTMKPKSL